MEKPGNTLMRRIMNLKLNHEMFGWGYELTPFTQSSTPYSCWTVNGTRYNLPPELCMTTSCTFLTLIIPGPHNPKSEIDVHLQPLI
jgi:hypothetical protein